MEIYVYSKEDDDPSSSDIVKLTATVKNDDGDGNEEDILECEKLKTKFIKKCTFKVNSVPSTRIKMSSKHS